LDPVFLKNANLGDMSKEILKAPTPAEIDALRHKTMSVVVQEDGEPCSELAPRRST
jgi:hypothetical protein